MSSSTQPKYESLQTYAADNVREKLNRLAALVSGEKQRRVTIMEAAAIAVDEALAARTAPQKPSKSAKG